jgi:hypothetical protein
LGWSRDNAYGTSFPDLTKAYRGGGWYFSTEQAFDLVVAYQLNPDPAYVDALLRNMNFEAGCNPVNVTYLTGLGWKRPRNVVDQYSINDRRAMPKDGVPQSNITPGFLPVWTYGWELSGLVYPADYTDTNSFPFYDRWCDDWNVSTEGSTTDTARSFAAVAWLAAQTPLASQAWTWTNASILVPTSGGVQGQPVTVALKVADTNLGPARILWEASGQEPAFGSSTYTFTLPSDSSNYWVEAEVQWPDGRRAFATNSGLVSTDVPALINNPQLLPNGGFVFSLAGKPQSSYVVQVSTDLISWSAFATNSIPANGAVTITDSSPSLVSPRYYRAVRLP